MEDEELRPGVRQWWRALAREQKTAMVVLCVTSVGVMGLAFGYWKTQIAAPFRISKQTVVTAQKFYADQEAKDPDSILEKQKTRDTDHDGLNDYDEQNVYRTSPYLQDSDSDGVSDMIEVLQGGNPLCPEGQTCVSGYEDVAMRATSTNADLLQTNLVPLPNAETAATSVQKVREFLDAPPDPKSLTPAQIKEYFISHNLVTRDQLAPLSDSQLIGLYQAAYEEVLRIKAAQAGANPAEYNPYGPDFNPTGE